MTGRTDTPPKPRTPLNRQRVLQTAIGLADHSGIEALSMRKLGRELGVEAMALYNHVAGKDDMIFGMVDLVWSQVTLPPARGDWKAALRKTAVSVHQTLLRHPWAGDLAISSGRAHPARMRYIDAICGRLRAAGLSAALTYHGYHAIDSHIIGFTTWYTGHSISANKRTARVANPRRSGAADDVNFAELPHLAEHTELHRSGAGLGDTDGFTFVLNLILDGLDRARENE